MGKDTMVRSQELFEHLYKMGKDMMGWYNNTRAVSTASRDGKDKIVGVTSQELSRREKKQQQQIKIRGGGGGGG